MIGNNPLCSVIIPAYNCEKYIPLTVQSVINQSYKNLEIIIIDDCSMDKTLEIITGMALTDQRIRIIENNVNIGVAETRNKGFVEAQGQYIALLDGDDLWKREKIEKQMDLMRQTDCDICYTAYDFIDANGFAVNTAYFVPKKTTFNDMLYENVIGCSTAVFKKELGQRHRMNNGYLHEDYVFWLELLRRNYIALGINESLAQYRKLKNSRSANKYQSAKGRWDIYRGFLKYGRLHAARIFLVYAWHGIRKHA